MNQYIEEHNGMFALHTDHTSYLFRVDAYGHLEHIHYGRRVSLSDGEALSLKQTLPYGTAVEYEDNVQRSFRDIEPFEYGNSGIGDYRTPSCLVSYAGGTSTDFAFAGFDTDDKEQVMQNGFPCAYDASGSLTIHLVDKTRVCHITGKTSSRTDGDSSRIDRNILSLHFLYPVAMK